MTDSNVVSVGRMLFSKSRVLDWVVIAAIIGAVAIIGFKTGEISITNIEYYSIVLSSVLAVVGVSITGYIFLIEYLRRLKTDRPICKDVADKFREMIFRYLFAMFIFGLILGSICAVFLVVYGDTDPSESWKKPVRMITLGAFIAFLYVTIRVDMAMMHVEGGIDNLLDKERKIACNAIRHDTDLIVRLSSEEYKEMIDSPEFVPGIPEVSYNGKYDMISFIRGSDTEDMRISEGGDIVRNNTNIVGYRDNRDEYDVRNVLNIFSDVELLLCRVMDVEGDSVPENVSVSTVLSSTNTQSNEIGLANDIEWYYGKIRKYRDYYILSHEYSLRKRRGDSKSKGSLKNFEDEKGKCIISGPWFLAGDVKADKDLPGDVSFENWREELRDITPYVFLLRYELSKKLSRRNISGVMLPGYDFSYASMNSTLLKDSYLAGVSFFSTDLTSANLSGSNLREADFKHSVCDGTSMRNCDLYNSSFADCIMPGAILAEASINNCLFPGIAMNNCDFHGALLLDCIFKDCNLSGSSFLDAMINKTCIEGCSVLNCDIKHSGISDCIFRDSTFNGSLFMKSSINRSSLIMSTFINSKLTESEMSALMILRTNFSNSEMQRINFTETQILAAKFKSSRLDESVFNKSSIGSYEMPPSDRNIMKLDHSKRMTVREYAKSFEGEEAMAEVVATRIGLDNLITTMDHASLRKCHFIETDISCTSICFAILEQVEFNKATISHSSFESSDMQNAVIINSRIDNCNMDNISFNGSSLTDVTIRDCTMINCNMTGCSLSDVTLERVDLENTSLTRTRIVGCVFDNVMGLDYYLLKDVDVLYNVRIVNCYDIKGNRIPDQTVMDKAKFIEGLRYDE